MIYRRREYPWPMLIDVDVYVLPLMEKQMTLLWQRREACILFTILLSGKRWYWEYILEDIYIYFAIYTVLIEHVCADCTFLFSWRRCVPLSALYISRFVKIYQCGKFNLTPFFTITLLFTFKLTNLFHFNNGDITKLVNPNKNLFALHTICN